VKKLRENKTFVPIRSQINH